MYPDLTQYMKNMTTKEKDVVKNMLRATQGEQQQQPQQQQQQQPQQKKKEDRIQERISGWDGPSWKWFLDLEYPYLCNFNRKNHPVKDNLTSFSLHYFL